MKRRSELALLELVLIVFAIFSISKISFAGQSSQRLMIASYSEAPEYRPLPHSPKDDITPAVTSNIFQLEAKKMEDEQSGRSIFTRNVSNSSDAPFGLKSKYSLEPYRSGAFDFELSEVLKGARRGHFVDIGTAFATNVIIHELGHDIVADHVGAQGSHLSFLQSKNGQFFFASSTVQSIDATARLPYSMGGEFASDFTFEYALGSYRKDPTLYNRSLMFFSGTEMLWYSLYAFYLSSGNDNLDPIAVTKYGGVSREAVLGVALAKTAMNAYRIYSGKDTVVPHFTITDDSVTLNLTMAF